MRPRSRSFKPDVSSRPSSGMRPKPRCVAPCGVRVLSKPYPLPIRFAFSASYHQVPGAPDAKRGFTAGRENMSQ